MFSLIQQESIVLLKFSEFLTHNRAKCLFLNNEPCMVRSIPIDLNPVEFKYYPFVISLDKCTGSCNVLWPNICVTKEIKDIIVKIFNMIANKNEPKAMTKHICCNSKCKLNSTACSSNQKWNNKACQCECKIYL